ncbi:cellulase family glycosylhydrolase [Porphyrobacter sp. YT40]|uniref:glycoside hydrolase 5 family protein n=1 Tax=Porphyrobacter sp. YT40 TaxID=2547601 RepID=UPI001143871A|nr:cellulase family glycosylhydrolase [Porphyrobacter sp. YT40]QDH34221.1 cellulase family glycosylhydrolase [Porphyrobacter sp. YT40]
MTITRRDALAGASAAVAALALPGGATAHEPPPAFVTREGTRLMRHGKPYRIVGANLWYAAWLGADAEFGDRARLLRELDRLKALGINNLRIMAAAEEGPLRNSIKPGFTRADGLENPALFEGLDFALAAIAERRMTAVLVLSNFWEWSGGLQTIQWRATGRFIDMGDPAHPWPAFADATAAAYANPQVVALYLLHVRALLARRNSVTGTRYADDPAIMSWQLANEPRPGGSDAAIAANRAAYLAWIAKTAEVIRAIAPHQLVSLGQEGTQATNGDGALVAEAHAAVDYVTAHIWPLNWSWVRGDDLEGTWPEGKRKVEAYIAAHVAIAEALGKPLLIEEFGFPRDGEAYAPGVATTFREAYYRTIYDAVETSWSTGGVIGGSNFWAWNGEARAAHPDARFRDGDRAYMGDPPHEPQGWYGVFDSDAAMHRVIRAHAALAAATA